MGFTEALPLSFEGRSALALMAEHLGLFRDLSGSAARFASARHHGYIKAVADDAVSLDTLHGLPIGNRSTL